jgi:DNA repair exonuclease SbcCD ATPase subunit
MKLLRVAYAKMCGFAGGELDLRQIGPGLVTLAGPNWNGKTTLLELPLAVFYREWASRTTNDVAHWADARDSWVEADFDVEGAVYRARVNIDGTTRKSQAVLMRQGADGWSLLTDGKVSTYDDAMATLVPPKDALLCSQFAAQNRAGSLTGASRSNRKDLFLYFLWLDRYVPMADASKQCAQTVLRTSSAVRTKIETLLGECTDERRDTLQAQHAEKRSRYDHLSVARGFLEEELADAISARFAIGDAVAQYLDVSERLTSIVARQQSVFASLKALPSQRDRITADYHADASRDRARVAKRTAVLVEKIEQFNALVGNVDVLRAQAKEKHDLVVLRAEYSSSLETLRFEEFELNARLQDARLADTVSVVPCGGREPYDQCGFLTEAVAALGRLEGRTAPDLEARLLGSQEESVSLLARRSAVDDRLKALSHVDFDLANAEVATERLAGHEWELANAREEHELHMASLATRKDERLTELEDELDKLREEEDALLAEEAACRRDVDVHHAAYQRALVLDASITKVKEDLATTNQEMAVLTTEIDVLVEQLAAWSEKRAAVDRLQPKLQVLDDELRLYTFLAKALHRDGLPTLEIAAAAPAISQLTTDLLEHSGFGTRFRVDVTTLVPTADGKDMKEDFAIRVYDNERGKDIKDIGDLSGGERILVEEALRAALTIYMASRHTHRVRTCWRDETTGPLDAENRPRYIAMLRRLRALGGYDHVIYVSHADDSIDAADTVVDVRRGAATIRRTG